MIVSFTDICVLKECSECGGDMIALPKDEIAEYEAEIAEYESNAALVGSQNQNDEEQLEESVIDMTDETTLFSVLRDVHKHVARANALLDKHGMDDFYRFQIVVLPAVAGSISIEFGERCCWDTDEDDLESVPEYLVDEMSGLIIDSDLETEQLRSIEKEYPELKGKIGMGGKQCRVADPK
jgi:hypothetical protein